MNIYRWWSPKSPREPDSLWADSRIIDTSFDVEDLEWYHPGRVLPVKEMQHQANIARLYLLYVYGGWWVDHDVQILCPMEDLPYPMTAAHSRHVRCNAIMGFPAGYSPLMDALEAIRRAPASSSALSVYVSGERLLNAVLPKAVASVLVPVNPKGTHTGAPEWCRHRYDSLRKGS